MVELNKVIIETTKNLGLTKSELSEVIKEMIQNMKDVRPHRKTSKRKLENRIEVLKNKLNQPVEISYWAGVELEIIKDELTKRFFN